MYANNHPVPPDIYLSHLDNNLNAINYGSIKHFCATLCRNQSTTNLDDNWNPATISYFDLRSCNDDDDIIAYHDYIVRTLTQIIRM